MKCQCVFTHYSNVTCCLKSPIVCWKASSGLQQSSHQSSTLLALCEGNPPLTGGFPSQRASNVEIILMSWCLHVELHLISANSSTSRSQGSHLEVGMVELQYEPWNCWKILWTFSSNFDQYFLITKNLCSHDNTQRNSKDDMLGCGLVITVPADGHIKCQAISFIEPMHRNKPNITYLPSHLLAFWPCRYITW